MRLSMEVRVGLLVLSAIVLLGGAIFVLSGVSLKPGYEVFVDFDNPGSVQAGAPVRIGGMKVGAVERVEYRGGKLDPKTGTRALVRMKLRIDREVRDTIHENALFYVTAQGVLGEQFIAIEPGWYEKPMLREGAVVHGVDPPRLDLALSLGYELLDAFATIVREHRDELAQMVNDLVSILHNVAGMLQNNRERVDRILANVETLTTESTELVRSAENKLDSAQVARIVDNIDRTLIAVSRDVGPILAEVRQTTQHADALVQTIGPEQRTQIQHVIAQAGTIADRADRTLADTQEMVAKMKSGHGTVGELVMDDEMYDDLQELIRDLKHNPWKFFWRE